VLGNVFVALDPCNSDPCQHGGTCISNNVTNTYVCDCDKNFDGVHCQFGKSYASIPTGFLQLFPFEEAYTSNTRTHTILRPGDGLSATNVLVVVVVVVVVIRFAIC